MSRARSHGDGRVIRAALDRVVVIDGGRVASLAAIAIKRTLPTAMGTMVTTPVVPGAFVDTANTALPSLLRLHERLGIDGAGMIARAGASHRLATLYRGWNAGSGEFSVGFAAVTPARAFRAGRGMTGDRDASTATPLVVLADAGRSAVPDDDPASPLSDLDYAIRFAPAAYRRRLASLAAHLGTVVMPTDAISPRRDPHGAVTALDCGDGRSLHTDLFVDAGDPGMLAPGDRAFVSWASYSPVDRVTLLPPAALALSLRYVAGRRGLGYALLSSGRDAFHMLRAFNEAEEPVGSVEQVAALAAGRLDLWRQLLTGLGLAAADPYPACLSRTLPATA